MSKAPASVDVLVIGGGPAGAATALKAARLGHAVCLVERGTERWHHGRAQSLAPSILPLLDFLDVRQKIEAKFPRSPGVLLLWGEDRPRYREFETPGGFQIERTVLDDILRTAAAHAGATVLAPANLLSARHTSDAAPAWRVRIALDGRLLDIRAKAIVDASGRKSCLPGRRTRNLPPLLALVGEWRAYPAPVHSAVEAARDCWFWAGPIHEGRITTAVFLDPRSPLITKGASLPKVYRSLLATSRVISGMLRGSAERVIARDATSRHVYEPVAEDLVRVGEAAISLDPLSSQGVQAALSGALQAAVVLNTWLRKPASMDAANAFYRERHREMIGRSEENTRRAYSEADRRFGTAFWHLRSSSQGAVTPAPLLKQAFPLPPLSHFVRLAAGVRVSRTVVIRGDLAEFAPAIVPAGAERPVAFVGEVPVGELAQRLVASTPVVDVVRTWSNLAGEIAALKALAWMWQAGVIAVE